MGILNLMKLINAKAPNSIKATTLESYSNKKVALDAPMVI